MTLSEVEILMQELGRHVSEQTQILFGAAVDARLGDRLAVTIISSLTAGEDLIPQQTQAALTVAPEKQPVWEQPQEILPRIEIEPEPTPMEASEPAEMTPFEEPAPIETVPPPPVEPILSTSAPERTRYGEPEPVVSKPHKTPAKEEKPAAEKSVQAKQEVLQFEAVTRGRFEKSEPTIVEGEDLDVPTYLRKNIKVK